MTTKSWMFLGVCALAGVVAARRRGADLRPQAAREVDRCDRLLRRLDARCANFR